VSEPSVEREQRVTPLELFFDLVFVFGFTQVTTVLHDNPTWSGLAHGLLILSVLWWAWAGYAWLTNVVDPSRDAIWITIVVAMAAMFIAALAVPEAFGRHGVVFGVALLIVTVMYVTLYALSTRRDRDLFDAVIRIAPVVVIAADLILVAGFVHDTARPLLWLAALLVGFFGPLLSGDRGWRVQPAHFVERHGLIVIIAIGESLAAIGFGARSTSLSPEVIVAALLGLVVATSFWLAYFDFFTIRAQQLLSDRSGAQRVALARDAYTYLHLPMIVGIVLFAFAMRTTLAHVGDELAIVPALSLCAGPALYLLAYVGLRFRISRSLRSGRLFAAVACALLIPVALVVPALVSLALVAAVWIALHAYELVFWREARAEAHAQRTPASEPA
jgi:low temperature requirement protein LtrA